MNRFKEKLRGGQVAFGQMVLELFTPGIGPMLAACGMDFVIYDMEHGRCDIGLAGQMIASCRGLDIVPMIRVPDLEAAPLSRVLDLERGASWCRASRLARRWSGQWPNSSTPPRANAVWRLELLMTVPRWWTILLCGSQ